MNTGNLQRWLLQVAAIVAEIRASSSMLGQGLTVESLAQQLSLSYGFGEMVTLRTTSGGVSAAARLQHQSHTFAVCNLWTGALLWLFQIMASAY